MDFTIDTLRRVPLQALVTWIEREPSKPTYYLSPFKEAVRQEASKDQADIQRFHALHPAANNAREVILLALDKEKQLRKWGNWLSGAGLASCVAILGAVVGYAIRAARVPNHFIASSSLLGGGVVSVGVFLAGTWLGSKGRYYQLVGQRVHDIGLAVLREQQGSTSANTEH